MEKIRVEKKNIYTIEVNDNGDTIEFDLEDIGLNFKLLKALKEVDRIKDYMKKEVSIIDKRQDVKGKYISKNEEDLLRLWNKAFKDMRNAMDMFLGEGACQKIFGDRNYIEMFDDLMDQLKPHLEKMKVSYKDIKDRIQNKYSSKNEKVIE